VPPLLAPTASPAEPVGTFSRVEGSVDILRRSDIAAVAVRTGDPVSMGDAVRTKRNGKAEIRFRDDTLVQLAPETRITIDEYAYRSGSRREKGFLSLFRGKVRAIVSKARAAVAEFVRTGSDFSIRTPTAIAGVKGTQFIVYHERGVTGAIFLDGAGFLYNPGRPERVVPIKGGQASFVMSKEDPPLDAQPVPESFVAPYLKDFPGSGPVTAAMMPPGAGSGEQAAGRSAGGAGASKAGALSPASEAPPTAVTVVEQNTTYEALVSSALGRGSVLGALAPPPLVLVRPVTIPIDPPGGVATLVPITDANPALLPSPVTVTVTIP
jgi:hypothetical protein